MNVEHSQRSSIQNHWLRAHTHLHVFCGVSQQTSEGDGVRHGSQVNEQNGRQGLDVKRIGEVTDKERRFSFDVQQEASTKPAKRGRRVAFSVFPLPCIYICSSLSNT